MAQENSLTLFYKLPDTWRYPIIQLPHSQFCQPVIDSCIKGLQLVVGQIVFVLVCHFSSVSLEVRRLRRNSHSCLVMKFLQ
ncbi:hypothetical protein SAMN03159286_3635 [Enterobacter sp. NFIX58]|nr:hypothetical protein SAMN03159286_3635 [Enterobacter sp. NFIX58]